MDTVAGWRLFAGFDEFVVVTGVGLFGYCLVVGFCWVVCLLWVCGFGDDSIVLVVL